ncbi:hypothetical protein FGO68_gene5269 [Halteria grandinella]|uniref:Uncharacterized protein n=1 Tax=Halteria grandinella TaxID=5974 RepID=A0A8J8TA62_HALGN|nr:hypothetical protein FGO68_gene5269 [Halteria grandinella]
MMMQLSRLITPPSQQATLKQQQTIRKEPSRKVQAAYSRGRLAQVTLRRDLQPVFGSMKAIQRGANTTISAKPTPHALEMGAHNYIAKALPKSKFGGNRQEQITGLQLGRNEGTSQLLQSQQLNNQQTNQRFAFPQTPQNIIRIADRLSQQQHSLGTDQKSSGMSSNLQLLKQSHKQGYPVNQVSTNPSSNIPSGD